MWAATAEAAAAVAAFHPVKEEKEQPIEMRKNVKIVWHEKVIIK